MGLFDFLTSGDASYGYKTYKNKHGWNNEKMLELLMNVSSTFGTPKMGWIGAFGKEREVVVFPQLNDINYIYVDAQEKKIIVSMAPKPGQVGGAVDHVDTMDGSSEDPDPLGATIDSMEPVSEICKVVEDLLNDPPA